MFKYKESSSIYQLAIAIKWGINTRTSKKTGVADKPKTLPN